MTYYNQDRTHTGKYCFGKTPLQTFNDTINLAKEKMLETLKEEQLITYPMQEKQQVAYIDFEETLLYSNRQSDNF
ncbi:hypothetical protein HMPREF0765_3602 [Sphingobacterium spiritivorum ATCC 33300]|uniref:Uncharacterized protein n=1 Tax=Sphingobacterium spiritivorum ATCC 33300 TaxID=525372 RepID=C2G1Z6_SPHSI|nr:hypothetical protein HMPREF0765_3602 [Sphingobacterium spiritivorum ATCC 33300]